MPAAASLVSALFTIFRCAHLRPGAAPPGYMTSFRQINDRLDDVVYVRDHSHRVFRNSWGLLACIGVSTIPGATALKRTPSFAYSIARLRARLQAAFRDHGDGSVNSGDGMLHHCRRDAGDAPPGLLRQHLFHCKLGDVEVALQIRFGERFEIADGVVRKPLREEDAGVIDHTIDRAESADRRC